MESVRGKLNHSDIWGRPLHQLDERLAGSTHEHLEGRDKFGGRLGKVAMEGGGRIRLYRKFFTAWMVQVVLLFGGRDLGDNGQQYHKNLEGSTCGSSCGQVTRKKKT